MRFRDGEEEIWMLSGLLRRKSLGIPIFSSAIVMTKRPMRLYIFALMLAIVLIGCSSAENPDPLDLPVSSDVAQLQPTATDLPPTAAPTSPPATATNTPQALPTAEPTATVLPTATIEPSPTPTVGPPTETPTPFPTPPPTWTPTPLPLNTPRPIPTETSSNFVEGTHCVIGVEPDDLLNIREEPSPTSAIIGTIPPYGQQVQLLGQSRTLGDSLWIEVDYFGRTGWVNSLFLARQVGTLDGPVADASLHALNALRDGDFARLADWVHPEKGLTFVPTTYVSVEHLSFASADLPSLWEDAAAYVWGIDQGTGEDIEMDFRAFYDRYLYSADYLFAEVVGYDTNVREGGLIDNSRDVFPDAQIVEYHFEGFDPDFGGLDFRTLRIVLEPLNGQHYVVAIVNNEWAP